MEERKRSPVRTTDSLQIRMEHYLDDFDEGKKTANDLHAVSNLISKMIGNKKTQLEYQRMRHTLINMPEIDWYEREDIDSETVNR